MITHLLNWLANNVLGLGIGQVGLAIGLIGSLFYWRRALGVFGLASSGIGRLVTVLVAIGVLRLTGIIPQIDVARATSLTQRGISWGLAHLPQGGLP